jgi:RNA polymerase sigma-70 factor (ECF subfamily)
VAPSVIASPSSEEASSDDDAALMTRLRQADRSALGALYDRYAPSLLATAVRMLGSRREAQDLLHDVFIEAWEHAREYDVARGTVRSWLFVRLRSRALDRLGRAERVRARSLEESGIELDLQRATSASGTVEVIAVNQALAQLPKDVREALDLTYFEGLTAREIAERAQVPIGTVRSRLARGLAALGVLLRRDEGVDDAG